MKKTQLPNIYGENVILPPALPGGNEKIPPSSKPPVITFPDMEQADKDQELINEIHQLRQKHLDKTRHKRDIDDLTKKIDEYESEMAPQRKTELPPPPEEEDPEVMSQRPTLRVASRLFNFFEKYATPPPPKTEGVILPPPDSEEESGEYDIKTRKLSPFLQKFVLEEGDDALDPSKFEGYEPESLTWRQDKLPEEVSSDLEEVQKDMALENNKQRFPSDTPAYEKEMIEFLRGPSPGQKPKAAPDSSTVPPPAHKKKASDTDQLLRFCKQYHDLCCKL